MNSRYSSGDCIVLGDSPGGYCSVTEWDWVT